MSHLSEASARLIEAEENIASALMLLRGTAKRDWVERLNAAINWIDITREAVAHEAGRVEMMNIGHE